MGRELEPAASQGPGGQRGPPSVGSRGDRAYLSRTRSPTSSYTTLSDSTFRAAEGQVVPADPDGWLNPLEFHNKVQGLESLRPEVQNIGALGRVIVGAASLTAFVAFWLSPQGWTPISSARRALSWSPRSFSWRSSPCSSPGSLRPCFLSSFHAAICPGRSHAGDLTTACPATRHRAARPRACRAPPTIRMPPKLLLSRTTFKTRQKIQTRESPDQARLPAGRRRMTSATADPGATS